MTAPIAADSFDMDNNDTEAEDDDIEVFPNAAPICVQTLWLCSIVSFFVMYVCILAMHGLG